MNFSFLLMRALKRAWTLPRATFAIDDASGDALPIDFIRGRLTSPSLSVLRGSCHCRSR